MEVGKTFTTFAELENAIRSFEKEEFVNYIKRDSTTVERARRKQPKRVFQ